jgi:hypothetical protein
MCFLKIRSDTQDRRCSLRTWFAASYVEGRCEYGNGEVESGAGEVTIDDAFLEGTERAAVTGPAFTVSWSMTPVSLAEVPLKTLVDFRLRCALGQIDLSTQQASLVWTVTDLTLFELSLHSKWSRVQALQGRILSHFPCQCPSSSPLCR